MMAHARSNSESSVNYSVQEYVNDIVYILREAAKRKRGVRILTSSPKVVAL